MPSRDELSAVAGHSPLILMYHAVVRTPLKIPDWCFVSAAAFEAQLEYLKARFDIVPLADIATLMVQATHRPTIAITFDDGFMNNYDVAFPIMRRAGIPATIFICTDLIDADDTLWFCRLNQALAETSLTSFEWRGTCYNLSNIRGRAATSALLQAELKQQTPKELMKNVAAITHKLSPSSQEPLEGDSPYRMLTRAALHEMQESRLIEFGAHTKSHAILKLLSTSERRDEIEGSINAVEKLADRPCRFFAYPNGQFGDYDEECMEQVAAAGVTVAVSAISGVNSASTSLLELRRIGVAGDLDLEDFGALVQQY